MNEREKVLMDGRFVKTLYSYGYEYHIVECTSRKGTIFPLPSFMGNQGFALFACKKITGYQKKVLKNQRNGNNY